MNPYQGIYDATWEAYLNNPKNANIARMWADIQMYWGEWQDAFDLYEDRYK